MKSAHRWIINLYVVNLALLFTHEMEGAYWHEWDMFGLPGDIEGYLMVNFVLLLVALLGLVLLLNERKSGYFFSMLLAATGIIAFPLHAAFVLTGHEEFKLAISWIILGTALAISIVQAYLTVNQWRGRKSPAAP